MPKGLPITKPMMIPLLLRLGIRAQCGVDSCCNHSTHSYSDRQNVNPLRKKYHENEK
jgi:hypothetical protein